MRGLRCIRVALVVVGVVGVVGVVVVAAGSAVAAPLEVRTRFVEGTLRGYPVVRDRDDRPLGTGTVSQVVGRDGILRVTMETRYDDGLHTLERMSFRQQPTLVQLDWAYEERHGDDLERRFAIDLTSGHAEQRHGGDVDDRMLRDTNGAFAGGGVAYAVKNLTSSLESGKPLGLDVVAFTPTPRLVHVTLSRSADEKITIGGRAIDAARYVIHPEVPDIAKLVVKAPDTVVWFSRSTPPALLRADTTRAEPTDPPIRIDLVGSR